MAQITHAFRKPVSLPIAGTPGFMMNPVLHERTTVKISARNVFKGSITHLQLGAVNAEVGVSIGGGIQITAIVTNGSVQNLGLALGKDVVVLVKASSVLVLVDGSGLRLSARNSLAGTITEVVDGPVGAEVTIGLTGGDVVHATITHDSVMALGLKKGMPATAVIKASSVILGVPN
jgi:molybdate transport system regulatory protein